MMSWFCGWLKHASICLGSGRWELYPLHPCAREPPRTPHPGQRSGPCVALARAAAGGGGRSSPAPGGAGAGAHTSARK